MENKPVRRRPPRTLQLSAGNDASQGPDEKEAGPTSPRKNRNSALIEKLQANLALSPTGPPTFQKSPGVVKLPVAPFPYGAPGSPSSPPVIITPKQEETPTSFEDPAEGGPLKSIIKGRARLSIKRRPPSRKHRKSSAEEGGEEVATPEHETPNGHEGEVFEEQKTSDGVDTASISKQQIEQETNSTDAEKLTSEDEKPEVMVETETPEHKDKDEGEQEEKTEEDVKEEKSADEPQLAESPSGSKEQEEAREEPVTQLHEKPQTESDETIDEKDTEQKEEVINQ
nr:duboraya isoform X2 [Misgurnus anguillicaudatus]